MSILSLFGGACDRQYKPNGAPRPAAVGAADLRNCRFEALWTHGVSAGVYQWTPLKHACLKHCRSPLQFLSHGFRKGAGGALRMGLEHGAFCVGCCWVLMGLLFVGGVMNLLWIAGIAAFVLIEKLAPFGHHTGRVTGVALALWGLYVVVQS